MANKKKIFGIILVVISWYLLAAAFGGHWYLPIGIYVLGIILYILGMLEEGKMIGTIFVMVGLLTLPPGLFLMMISPLPGAGQFLGWAYPIILISVCIIVVGIILTIILFVLKRKKVKRQQEQEFINAGKNE